MNTDNNLLANVLDRVGELPIGAEFTVVDLFADSLDEWMALTVAERGRFGKKFWRHFVDAEGNVKSGVLDGAVVEPAGKNAKGRQLYRKAAASGRTPAAPQKKSPSAKALLDYALDAFTRLPSGEVFSVQQLFKNHPHRWRDLPIGKRLALGRQFWRFFFDEDGRRKPDSAGFAPLKPVGKSIDGQQLYRKD
jgi:hypothetical protein